MELMYGERTRSSLLTIDIIGLCIAIACLIAGFSLLPVPTRITPPDNILKPAEEWHVRGMNAWEAGNLKDAATAFRKAIDVYPEFVKGLSDLGALLEEMGQHEESMNVLKKAVSLDPKAPDAWFNLGVACLSEEDWHYAGNAFQKAVNADPKDGEAWFNLGVAREKGGDKEGAVLAYHESLFREPEGKIEGKIKEALGRLENKEV
jgi:tetratricopeptide (TPR) repeat protein